MLFDNNTVYTPKQVMEKLQINKNTLLKYCKNGLVYVPLPGSNHRRYLGSDLNNFFSKTE